jgi:hypothetical protein
MTINPQNERSRRARRFKGLVAGAAGVALLLGGSTFAYWSVEHPQAIGDISKNGYLAFGQTPIGVAAYDLRNNGDQNPELTIPYTVSVPKEGADGETEDKTISLAYKANPLGKAGEENAAVTGAFIQDLTAWRGVPGDQVEVDVPINIQAVGNNMSYTLQVKATDDFNLAGWTVKAQLYKAALDVTINQDGSTGKLSVGVEKVSEPFDVTQINTSDYIDLATDVRIPTTEEGQVFVLVFTATLDQNLTGTSQMDTLVSLSGVNLKLVQVNPFDPTGENGNDEG